MLFSVGLHVVAVLVFLTASRDRQSALLEVPAETPIEVEVISDPKLGRPPLEEQDARAETTPETPPPAAPAPEQATAPETPPPPEPEQADLPLPPPPPPQQARPAAPPPPAPAPAAVQAPPAVRLGAGPEGRDDGTTDIIVSDITTPPDRDPEHANIPPRYPPEAARRGQQGTVVLRLYIAPDGNVMSAEVAGSSGFPLLDRAAREAVTRWHFRPAKLEGHAIPGSLLYRLVFELG